jgi:TonB family protein
MFRVLFLHVLPFIAAMFFGVAAYYVAAFYWITPFDVPAPQTTGPGTVFYGSGAGKSCRLGKGSGYGSGVSTSGSARRADELLILSKPKALYTDAARVNDVEGSVRLKVTLLASGEVGSIVPVTTLPHGLTEQAVAAARQIKFEPKKLDGVPVSTTVTIDYSFEIY